MYLGISRARAAQYAVGLMVLIVVALVRQCDRWRRARTAQAVVRARTLVGEGFEGEGKRRW